MEQEELIQKYIQNSLSVTERQQFETLLENDLDFANKVAQHNNVHKAIKAHEKEQLKSHLQEFEAKQSAQKTPETSSRNYIRLAVAVVLLLFFGLLGNYIVQQVNFHENLYVRYFEPYPNALQPVTRGQNDSDLLSKATRAYEAKKYATAIETFDLIQVGLDNPNVEISFYKAMSLLNLGKEKEALDLLRKIKHSETRFTPQIYWYGALIHLKFKEEEKALKALEYMDRIQTGYKSEARIVLKEKLQK
jgi:tetratricopeptide (TPR) repeat protein